MRALPGGRRAHPVVDADNGVQRTRWNRTQQREEGRPTMRRQASLALLATILSVAMLLEHSLDAPKAAAVVRDAVEAVLMDGHRTEDLLLPGETAETIGCRAMGDLVLERLGASR